MENSDIRKPSFIICGIKLVHGEAKASSMVKNGSYWWNIFSKLTPITMKGLCLA